MAAPDVVCQPCGSALGAPTKECSTAHKTLFLPKNGSRGAPTSVTRGRNGRRSPHSKHLTSTAQPRSRRIATSLRPSATAGGRERFSRAVVAPHRAVTSVRCAGSAAPRCGSRRTCPTAARCSASSSPRASTGSRPSARCSPRPARAPSCGARQCPRHRRDVCSTACYRRQLDGGRPQRDVDGTAGDVVSTQLIDLRTGAR